MMRLLAVVIVVLSVVWIRSLGARGIELPMTALALGFTLVVAMVAGELLRRFKLPRLTGYLLFGVLIGPYLVNVISEPMTRQLQAINGVATALIAFIAGLTLNFERIGRRTTHTTRMIAITLTAASGVAFALAVVAWPWLPIAPEAVGAEKVVMAAMFAIIVVSFSPTMTAAVISETGARGPLSEIVLAIVVIADLVALVSFSLTMQFARSIMGGAGGGADVNVIVRLAWEIGGAIAFGCLIGSLLAMYLRYIGREVTLVLLGVCTLLGQVGARQGFEPLLAAMAAGMVIQNVAVPQADALKVAIQRGALPVLIVFFVATGASLNLTALTQAGLVTVALMLTRVAVMRIGVAAGLRLSRIDLASGSLVWTGLISQAGITLGLASVLATEFPTWGGRVQTLLVALIALDELVGPLLFRRGLAQAGEIETETRHHPLIVVSNREPYLHNYGDGGTITVSGGAGGVAVALDALMRERHGVWIAYGDGTADRAVVDAGDKVRVPPEQPSYDLRRLWIDRPTYDAYYGGFANEGLWPLCHSVDVRPQFRSEDWLAYQSVNAQFAEAIHQELPTPDTPVFIQDYHLALVAARLRERRSTAHTALFWHIPWPYPDRLRICPWRREILEGLLANDLVAFQVERDRRNFLLAVEDELEAEIDSNGQRVWYQDRVSTITSVPIGVDYDRIQSVGADVALIAEQQRLRQMFGLGSGLLGLGVDRLDYTKGIPERLAALDRVFQQRPELRGKLTFLQIGVPSRSSLESYAAIEAEIDRIVASVNARHGIAGLPPPIRYFKGSLGLASLVALYRMAHFCIVSSLHDGMNLVAKEFIAARDDEDGVLVLSGMAGAAQELQDALIINPYDVDGFAVALIQAIDMPPDERRRRMQVMRRVVAGRNVFGWASDILEGLESIWTKPLQYATRAPEDVPI